MEFDKRKTDIAFEKFLKHSAVAINQRRENPLKGVSFSYKTKIFEEIKIIFDMDPNLNISTFKKNYIKRVHLPIACKENIIKMLYLIIFDVEINTKKDLENQIDALISLLKKVKNYDLPMPKKYLTEKFRKLKNIKIIETTENNLSTKLINEIDKFERNDKLDAMATEKLINLLGEYMEIEKNAKEKSENLQSFCQILETKILNYEDQKNSREFYRFVEDTNQKLKTLCTKTDSKEDSETIENCIDNCEEAKYKFMTNKEKFKQLEKNRKNKSHNKESLKHFLELQKSTISQANAIINQTDGISPITESELTKLKNCEDFLEKSNLTENIDKKTFDSYVKEMQNETKKIIAQRLKKSTYGQKKPTSKEILSKILNLF